MPKRNGVRLTNESIRKLKPRDTPYDVSDAEVAQLVLRVTPNGHKSFFVRFRRKDGTQTRSKVGDVSALTVDQARKEARRILTGIVQGKNPNEEKRLCKAELKAQSLTLEKFLDEDYGKWAMANRKDGARNVPRLKSAFGDLLKKPLRDITTRDVEEWRTKKIKAKWAKAKDDKETINRSRAAGSRDIALLKACMSRAVQMGHLATNPLKGECGVKITKVDRKSTIRAITSDEEKALFAALMERETDQRTARASHNKWLSERHMDEMPPLGAFTDYLRPYITLLLNTGLRRAEGFQLKWSDIDFQEKELKVRAGISKSGRERIVPLNAVALETLKTWRDQNSSAGLDDVVFASPQTGDMLTHINTTWRGVTKKAGLKGLRLHDLRHTFASRTLEAGATIVEVQELLGHADLSTTSIYLHTSKEGKRRAVNALANVVDFQPAQAQG